MYKPSSYLALDPGHTTGWATFDDKGNILEMGQFTLKEVNRLNELIHDNLKTVIVEDYRNHGFTQQKKWSRNETSKIIGRIEALCEIRNIEVVLQPNTVRGIGYKWMGSEQPTNHSISHQWDAAAHGVYWLQKNGVRPVGQTLKERGKKSER